MDQLTFAIEKIECSNPKIRIASIVNGSSAIFYEEGEIVFHMIDDGLSKYKKVELSFKGLKHVTTAFLSASIGNIYFRYKDEIADKLSFSDIPSPLIKQKINNVIEHAHNAEEYDKLIDDALADL